MRELDLADADDRNVIRNFSPKPEEFEHDRRRPDLAADDEAVELAG